MPPKVLFELLKCYHVTKLQIYGTLSFGLLVENRLADDNWPTDRFYLRDIWPKDIWPKYILPLNTSIVGKVVGSGREKHSVFSSFYCLLLQNLDNKFVFAVLHSDFNCLKYRLLH